MFWVTDLQPPMGLQKNRQPGLCAELCVSLWRHGQERAGRLVWTLELFQNAAAQPNEELH